MATGLLVIGFGSATRLLKYVVGTSKTYEAVIRLGASTSTDDAEGDIAGPQTEAAAARIDALSSDPTPIDAAIADHLTGTIDQIPSTFSAIKVNGERAYDLAREGKDVQLAARKITISDFTRNDVRAVTDSETDAHYLEVTVSVTCSAGTYIRALARDLGALLEVGGYLTYLRRTRIGAFTVESATVAATKVKTFTDRQGVVQHRLKANIDAEDVAKAARDVTEVIGEVLPVVDIDEAQLREIGFGRDIDATVAAPTAAIFRSAHSAPRLCAIVEPGSMRGTAHPIAVFPRDTRSDDSKR
jgi:tRNA pseudouridine55 synthase